VSEIEKLLEGDCWFTFKNFNKMKAQNGTEILLFVFLSPLLSCPLPSPLFSSSISLPFFLFSSLSLPVLQKSFLRFWKVSS
jgi:hypothetical protein